MTPEKTLLVILGPTAIGKTSFAIEVANHYNTEIISADSRQFFKELNIGVARPSHEQLQSVRHHFIDFVSVQEHYSAGMFERDALAVASHLFATKDFVVCVGGSMMYIDALTEGLDDLPSDKLLKQKLIQTFNEKGLGYLQQTLLLLDPEYCHAVDQSNAHRLIRAIEVCTLTGEKYSTLRSGNRRPNNFKVVKIGLAADRKYLYQRINQRVDDMMQQGLLKEAESLLNSKDLMALNTVGYKELFEYFDNKCTLETAVEKIKQHTRNYAKRQLTWWRKDEKINWINITNEKPLLSHVLSLMS